MSDSKRRTKREKEINDVKKIALKGLSNDWLDILDNSNLDDIFSVIDTNDITPKLQDIFNFARYTDVKDIKIVILGQDPYPTPDVAHGLAFSSIGTIEASVRNIFKSLLNFGFIESMPISGNLTGVAKNGVLLLNSALTTIPRNSGSHLKIWASYTNSIISRISNKVNNAIFMLWGKFAGSKINYIDSRCKVLQWVHPSPFNGNEFISCDNFSIADKELKSRGDKGLHEIFKQLDYGIEEKEKEKEKEKKTDVYDTKHVDSDDSDNDNDEKNEDDIIEKNYTKISSTQKWDDIDYTKKIIIFTDGSCYPNKKDCKESKAGYAASIYTLGITISGNLSMDKPRSNIRAEGFAIHESLKYLSTKRWKEIVIVTDSEFWKNMYEKFMPTWSKKNKPFDEYQNSDITIPMWKLYTNMKKEGYDIKFVHVKSHNKSGLSSSAKDSFDYLCYIQNEYVDEYATYARKSLVPGCEPDISFTDYD